MQVESNKREALFYEREKDVLVCHLCPHACRIKPEKRGICRSRLSSQGKLWAINYGKTTSLALDPIEKKPLYHFHPGRQIISIAPNNCNMACPYCQNWKISQEEVSTQFISPEMLVNIMKDHNSFGVSYTYTEPLVWYEYLLDAGALVRKEGGKNVLVTNGLINEEPLRKLLPLIDAMNIDLKIIDNEIYRTTLKGDLSTVKRTIEIAHQYCHVEITNLLVTGLNDKKKDIKALIEYIMSVSKSIPLHFSRYYPNYRYEQPPTLVKKLEYAFKTAKEMGMQYVYLGNVPSEEGSNTYCPACQALLIERMYYQAMITGMKGAKCKKCGEKINIVV